MLSISGAPTGAASLLLVRRAGAAAVAAGALATVTAAIAEPQATPIFAFGGASGAVPSGPLVHPGGYQVIGTATEGGQGAGVVFKLRPPHPPGGTWNETILYSFSGGADGGTPTGELLRSDSGTLYGTTLYGGDTTDCPAAAANPAGCGVVYKLTPPDTEGGPWTETVIYTFHGADGSHPQAGLIRDGKGDLFGTTIDGGANGAGTVFRITPPTVRKPASEAVLYSFAGGTDGGAPYARLLRRGGDLFGTTLTGGDLADCPASGNFAAGCGVVFRVRPSGTPGEPWIETILHTFTGASDGGYPYSGIVADPAGRFYGTTSAGGNVSACPAMTTFAAGCGVVYELAIPDEFGARALGVLYSFSGGEDGRAPLAQLTQRPDHSFIGSTFGGGITAAACDPIGCGTAFALSSADSKGVIKKGIIWSFTGASDGGNPAGKLSIHNGGELFGTTETGGANGDGTVFHMRKR